MNPIPDSATPIQRPGAASACDRYLSIRQVTRALAFEDHPGIQRGSTCASCGRTVPAILYQESVPKCSHCSRPLSEGEAGVTIEGDRFHDACLRRLVTDETIRLSRAMNEQSRQLIERSRRALREGHAWPDIDKTSG